jgi:hypothetical protein
MRDSFPLRFPTNSVSLLAGVALSYFHSERSEESLLDPTVGKNKEREILRFAQNDRKNYFSAGCLAAETSGPEGLVYTTLNVRPEGRTS